MKKILFIIFAVLLIAIAGCAVKEKAAGGDKAEAIDSGTTASISETDDISSIEDTQAEKELDNVSSSLSDW